MYVYRKGFPDGSVVKNPPAKQETLAQSLGWEDPLKEEMATHSSILAWETPWTEEPGRLQCMWLWKRHDLATKQQQHVYRKAVKRIQSSHIPHIQFSSIIILHEWVWYIFHNSWVNIDTLLLTKVHTIQVALVVKNPPASLGNLRDLGSIPGLGRSPGGGKGNPFQYSCLENPMDRGAWRATVHRVAKSQTRLKRLSTHAHYSGFLRFNLMPSGCTRTCPDLTWHIVITSPPDALGREGRSDFPGLNDPSGLEEGWAGMCTLSLCWFVWCFLVVFLGLWVCRRKTTEGNCPSHHILSGLFSQHESSCALDHLTEVCLLGVTTEEFLFLPHPSCSLWRGDPHLWPTLKEGLVSLPEGRVSTYVPSDSFTRICLFSSFLYLFNHFYISIDSCIPMFTLCVLIWGLPCCLFCCASYSSLSLGNSFILYPF